MRFTSTIPSKCFNLFLTFDFRFVRHHILYRKLFAIYSLLPLVIVIIFATTFFIRRDLHTLTYAIGVIINYMGNYALKQYLAEPRPMKREIQFEEYGMPS